MPVAGDIVGDVERMATLRREFFDLANRKGVAFSEMTGQIKKAVRGLLKYQFAWGIDPAGTSLKARKDGAPALISKKLPSLIKAIAKPGEVTFGAKWRGFEAHNFGHVFPSRNVAGGEKVARRFQRTRDERGRLKKGGEWVDRPWSSGAHVVGQRILPRRQILPDDGTMPPRWDSRIREAVEVAMVQWYLRSSR